jgi:two-component system sensor histidine kinase KdpD
LEPAVRSPARVISHCVRSVRPYLGSLAVALGALAIALLIEFSLDVNNPSRVFLVAVLISAIAYGLWPALFASLISAIAYDYFFLPPVYTLSIATNEGIIDFSLFVLVALIVSALAARVRRYALAADARALTAETLSAFTQCLAEASTAQTILDKAADQMSALLGMPVALVLTEEDMPVVNAACPPHLVPDIDCLRTAVAWWALRPEEAGSQGLMIGNWRFHNLRGAGEAVGLIATRPGRHRKSARAAQDTLLGVLAYQTGLAIDRITLRDRLDQSRARAETERLRSTVLTSISHDLRNPLASITASASVLERHWKSLDDTSKLLMARTIRDEAERLDGFIGKLLDLTNIESKMIKPHCRSVFVLDVVEAALQRASTTFVDHRVAIDVPGDLPRVMSDAVLLQQVLYNLIENAAKYSPPGSLIHIIARQDGGSISISVLDEGAGIPDADVDRIFDRFYRARAAEPQATGTGLGLAICRGFLEVMHGSIEAANRDDRSGAALKIILPIAIHRELQEVEL